MNLPAKRDKYAETMRRLELAWCAWPSGWESFVEHINDTGTELEKVVIEKWPKAFQSSAVERAARMVTWQENQIPRWLSKMDKLTDAKKTDQNGDKVEDNPTQLGATKYLLDRVLGQAREKDSKKPGSNVGEGMETIHEERDKLAKILRKEGVTVDAEFETKRESSERGAG